ncbi:MAG: hypothetical protein U1E36_08125 [Rickettsiales bacterium]
MADDKDKKRPREVLDVNAPITAEELREHEVVEHLLKTHPELQEKSEVGNAVSTGVKKFKFSAWDLVGGLAFGAVFGLGLYGAAEYVLEPVFKSLATSSGFGLFDTVAHFFGGMGALGGTALAMKSAVGHTVGEACKGFYDKCKDGYAEAKEHNEAVQFLKQRVSAIKMYKQKHFMKHIMDNPDGFVPSFQPAENTTPVEYENPRSRVVDAILSEKRKAVPEITWTQRAETQATTPNQPSL